MHFKSPSPTHFNPVLRAPHDPPVAIMRPLAAFLPLLRRLAVASTAVAGSVWLSPPVHAAWGFGRASPSAAQPAPVALPLPPVEWDVKLFAFEGCPFCNKVATFLDYYDIPYTVVQVNPVTRAEIDFSTEYARARSVVALERLHAPFI